MKKITFVSIMLIQVFACAGLLYPYNRLATKDLDQMSKLVKEKIKEAKSAGGNRTIPLKEALQAIFSRPNDDSMIEKLLPSVKNELEEHAAYEKTFHLLVKEAAGALNNPKAFKAEALVTYIVFLENTLSEMKPKMAEPFEKGIFVQIRDAKIQYTKELLNERKHRMLKDLPSVSELATTYLTEFEEKEKAASKEAAKKAEQNPAPKN